MPPQELGGLKEKWEACRAQDDQKTALVVELFRYIEAQSRLLAQKESIINQTQKEKRELMQKQDARNYILVLIDGDCMPFLDDLVRWGEGAKAARALKEAIKTHWASQFPQVDIVVRIYANMKGMGVTYENYNVLKLSDWYAFVSEFNKVDPLVDYIDAGNGKECADHKIKTTFQHHFANIHCQRIVLGASADNGYARLLDEYVGDKSCERIALIRGPNFARELEELSSNFKVYSFSNVFSSRKLHRVSFDSSSRPPSRGASRTRESRPTTPDGSLKSALKSPRPVSVSPVAISRILRNQQGQRVDSHIKFNKEVYQEVKGWRLCNKFHLLGDCPDGWCRHDHTRELTGEQKDALRALSRGFPCDNGLYCSDENCLAGHCCRYFRCTRKDCRFSPDMHGVDTRVAA